MSTKPRWLKKPNADHLLGIESNNDGPTWISMTAGLSRWAVGVSAPNLTLQSSNKSVVEAEYDKLSSAKNGYHPVVLKAGKAGEAKVSIVSQGKTLDQLAVSVFPLRKVSVTFCNVESEVTTSKNKKLKLKGTIANSAKQIATKLDQIFVSQGGLQFQPKIGKPVELLAGYLVQPKFTQDYYAVDGRSKSIRPILGKYVDNADFTVFCCWSIWGAPCALGLNLGKISLIDESLSDKRLEGQSVPDYYAHVIAHELCHGMGHSGNNNKIPMTDSHSGLKSNLMYYQFNPSRNLTRRQIELIANPSNWSDK